MAHLHLCEGWRLSEDGQLQWILQRHYPEAKNARDRWRSVAYCGTREGLLEVALPHNGVQPTDAACASLKRLPRRYELNALDVAIPFPCWGAHYPTIPDSDGDQVGDLCDNCPNDFNEPNVDWNAQDDFDGDGIGDICDPTPVPEPGNLISLLVCVPLLYWLGRHRRED